MESTNIWENSIKGKQKNKTQCRRPLFLWGCMMADISGTQMKKKNRLGNAVRKEVAENLGPL